MSVEELLLDHCDLEEETSIREPDATEKQTNSSLQITDDESSDEETGLSGKLTCKAT